MRELLPGIAMVLAAAVVLFAAVVGWLYGFLTSQVDPGDYTVTDDWLREQRRADVRSEDERGTGG